jgi:pseudouridine kinase
MALAVNDMRIVTRITPERLAPLAADIASAQALLLDCNLTEAALARLCTQDSGVPIFVDTVSTHKCQRIAPWLGHIHLLKPNRLEAQALTGLPLDNLSDAPAVVAWLHRQGVRQVVLSFGEQGVFWSDVASAQGLQPAPCVSVVNATGAGDALMAGLIHAYVMGQPLSKAVQFASACAALTLGVQGANHPQLSPALVQHCLRNPLMT